MNPWFPLIVSVSLSLIVSTGASAVYAYVRVDRAMVRAGLRPEIVDDRTSSSSPRPARQITAEEQLAEVGRLHAAGAITANEYELIRRSILWKPDSAI